MKSYLNIPKWVTNELVIEYIVEMFGDAHNNIVRVDEMHLVEDGVIRVSLVHSNHIITNCNHYFNLGPNYSFNYNILLTKIESWLAYKKHTLIDASEM